MAIPDLLAALEQHQETRRSIAHIEVTPAREAVFGSLVPPLPEPLEAYLARRRIRLYSHQCAAIEAIREGRSVIMTTATASGKSLAFNLPVFERLVQHPDATALYLYPTKALAHDQLKGIREIEQYTGITTGCAVYDGDTPRSRRPALRERARILLSNPHELHQILPWHDRWRTFFSRLRFVVIDEAHRYRGVFGSHAAFLLRRLLRIAHLHGGTPQFVLSTATVANPGEFACRLCGMPVTVIDDDGSPRGETQFLLCNPYSEGAGEGSTHRAARDLLARCIQHGLQALCFTTSRKHAELLALHTRAALVTAGEEGAALAAYRAGYLPGTRRELEENLKCGHIRGLVSTNALEVGIDVGTLDAVIIAGYPGSIMATRQQAGRAGRRNDGSFAALVASHNPLDQFFMHHPGALFEGASEHAIIDLANPYIVAGHLLCAAAEAPLAAADCARYFGDGSAEIAGALEAQYLLRMSKGRWIYAGRGRATEAVGLGSGSGETYRVLCNGSVLETIDRSQAFREAHPGAVFLHQGETYLVDDLDVEAHRIRLRKEETDLSTEPLTTIEARIIAGRFRRDAGGLGLVFGDVEVVEHTVSYRIKRYDRVIATEPLDLPPLRFATKGVWCTIPETVCDRLARAGLHLAGGLHGAEHALIGIMPSLVLCDRRDIGGFSSSWFPSTGSPAILIYDGVEGGIGLAEKGYALFEAIAAAALAVVRECPCDDGCPGCIYSPKCGNDNQPLDKQATEMVLEEIVALLAGGS
ncbi:MAG TPA: DEAD/DEAH box helicase [Methanoculleus sp.]|nr:DEAD/DEAH box helicase [Methanoculleus sp.]